MGADAIVAGAGPVGLMVAGELRLAGVDVSLLEQLAAPTGESRGIGLTRRAAEVLDQRGLLARLGELAVGNEGHFGGVRIDLGMLEENHSGIRGVPQHRVEEMLEAWVRELGVRVRRGHKVVNVRQGPGEVSVTVQGPAGRAELTAGYLVGCDGGRSTVRQRLGIGFPGRPATRGMYAADVAGCDIRPRAIGERVPGGMVMAVRLGHGVDRIVLHPDALAPRDSSIVTAAEVADSWQRLTGQSLHGAEFRWVSAFTDATRQAARYRLGRVLLAGDATHVHVPAGAQGLSLGLQDAVNLGWKLAATVNGWAPADLLDTYHTERHPAGARVLTNTLAQAALYLAGDEMEPLRAVLRELVAHPEVAGHLAGKVSGLDVRYDMGCAGHPLVGLRVPPDRELRLAGGRRVRVATLLHAARGVLVDTGDHAETSRVAAGWAGRVDVVAGQWADGGPDGQPPALGSALVRPDGYLAWARPGCGGLGEALSRWFGLAVAAG